jgi:hypothetical protein
MRDQLPLCSMGKEGTDVLRLAFPQEQRAGPRHSLAASVGLEDKEQRGTEKQLQPWSLTSENV